MAVSRRRSPVHSAVRALVAAAVALIVVGATAPTPAALAEPSAPPTSPGKGIVGPSTTGGQVNPYLGEPVGQRSDRTGWRQRLAAQGRQRAASAALATARTSVLQRRASTSRVLPPALYEEQELVGTLGSNDDQANAEPVPGFGTGRRDNPRARVQGAIAEPAALSPVTLPPAAEDNGSIPLAVRTGISGSGAILTTGVLGDGPHGAAPGDGSNDFDVYAFSVGAGATVRFSTIGSSVDTVIGLYDDAGALVASDDDGGFGVSSLLTYRSAAAGDYYALIASYNGADRNPFPSDPYDSGSGNGQARQGAYRLDLSAQFLDADVFSLDLAAGDVLGISVIGTATGVGGSMQVYRPDGTAMVGGQTGYDRSALYAAESPLPGGGDVVLAHVAEQSGSYAVEIQGSPGDYDATVEAYRPGLEVDTTSRAQTFYLDFDGARLSTVPFDPVNGSVRTLSPLSTFVAKWGLTRSDLPALIDAVTDGVRENVRRDAVAAGLNPAVGVRVVSSQDGADLFGRDNVSRVVVGGTRDQLGLNTIGVAQTIDPGNFGHQDQAVVLLDVLSQPAGEPSSLNTYLTPDSDRLDFVARGLATAISHEIGHLLGNFHTDAADDVASLMDSGGPTNRDQFFGVGPDGVGGTADDVDVDFTTDTYAPSEGFRGQEDTLAVVAWGLSRSTRALR